MKIWFHGTATKSARKIRRQGFRADSWFAAHLEDALTFGGPHVFQVASGCPDAEGRWQVQNRHAIPKDQIISYTIYREYLRFDRANLRREVFQANVDEKPNPNPDDALPTMADVWGSMPNIGGGLASEVYLKRLRGEED